MQYQIVPVTPFEQNCTLLWCPETLEAVVVDPGGDIERIEKAIAVAALKPVAIVLTHGHLDHVGAAGSLRDRLAVPILGPQADDAFWLRGLSWQAEMFGLEAGLAFEPDRWLAAGDVVTVGRQNLEVLHTPGHTPGHIALVHKPTKLAVVGDVLFQGSIGRTDFPKGDFRALIDSITNKLFPLGDDFTFIPGHGSVSTFGRERRTNPFLI